MIRTHYRELLAEFPELQPEVERLAARTYELTDFLLNVLKVSEVPGRWQGTITYHDSCSGLRELGVKAQPRALLARVPGLELKEMSHARAVLRVRWHVRRQVRRHLHAHLRSEVRRHRRRPAPSAVVLGDLGCMLNIEGRLRRRGEQTRVLHVAEVLAGVTEPG